MLRNLGAWRIGIGITLLTAVLAAQSTNEGPRALFERALAVADARHSATPDQLASLFDLSDLPEARRHQAGQKAGAYLVGYLDRLTKRLDLSDVPDATFTGAIYLHPTEQGTLECVLSENGWVFTKRTRENVSDYFAAVSSDKQRVEPEPNSFSSWLRPRLPAWMLAKPFVLQNWQWLGILLITILGLMAGLIARLVIGSMKREIAERRDVEFHPNRKSGRPFALFATAAVWLAGIPFLDLSDTTYEILNFAARLVLMVAVIWSLSRIVDWASDIFAGFAKRSDNRVDDLLVPMLRRALKVFIVVLGLVWIADNLGMNISALLAGLGIGGLAIAMASKDTVENFFGAVGILTDQPFQVGDWIKTGGIEGAVEEVGFRSTRVRTFYNSLITFPNAMLIRTSVDNLGARKYRRCKESLGIAYDTPPQKVAAFTEGIRELIRLHPYTRKDYYHVYFHSFGESSLNILMYLFFNCGDWSTELRERQRLMLDILRLANKLGIEFAFPTQTLHVVQSEMPEHQEYDSMPAAHRGGRQVARAIVDEFTGRDVPPPVVIGTRPDDAEGSGGDGDG